MPRSAPSTRHPGGPETSPRGRHRTRLARALRGAALLLGLALLAGALGLFPQEPLRRLAERTIREATGEGSRLGGLHVVPLLLQADVRDLRVERPGLVLVVPAGRIRVSPRALTEGAIFLDSLELDALRLELRPEPTSAPATGAVPLPPLRIDRLAVRDASVVWEDAGGRRLDVDSVTARGSLGIASLEVDAAAIRWTAQSSIVLGPASARLTTTPLLDVTVERLDLGLGKSRLAAHGPLLRRATLAPELDLSGALDLSDAGSRVGQPELSGSVAVAGRVEGPVEALSATAQVDGNAGYGEWDAERLDARLAWQGGAGVAEARVTARALGGSLEAEGRLGEGRAQGRLRAEGLDLARLPPSVADGAAEAGRVDVALSWDGPLDGGVRVDARASGDARGAAGSGRFRAEVHGTVRPVERSVDLAWTTHLEAEAAAATAPSLELEASGHATGPLPPRVTGTVAGTATLTAGERRIATEVAGSFDAGPGGVRVDVEGRGPAGSARVEAETRGERLAVASLHAEALDLGLLVPGAAGDATVDVSASGPLRRPALSLDLRASGLVWQGVTLGRLDARARGDLARLDLNAGLSDLSMETESELLIEPSLRLRGRTRLVSTPLAALAPLVPAGASLTGHVTATVLHDVPLDRPAEGDWALDVEALDAEYEGQRVHARPFTLTLRDGRLVTEDLAIDGPGMHLEARVDAGLAVEDPLEIDARLSGELSAVPAPEGWSVSGSVGADVHVRGSRARPRVEGVVRGEGLTAQGLSWPEVRVDEVRLPLTDEALTIPGVVARVGNGRATLEGEIPWASFWTALREGDLKPTERARVSLGWDDVDIDALGGTVSGELTVDGGLASVDEPRAVLAFPGARLRLEGVPVEVAPTTVTLDAGRVTTTGLTVGNEGGQLVVTGEADLREGSVDVRGKGRLALGVLSPLLGEAAVAGRADLDLAVAGPLDAPSASGTVQVEGASVRLRGLPQAVTGLSGRVEFADDTARLEATGRLGGGTLHLVGETQVETGALGNLWLQLTGREVALQYPPGLRSRLDVDLTLAGRPGDFVLAGDVAVQRGVYEIEEAIGEALRAAAPAATESEMLRGVSLDVRVDIVRPVLVRSSYGDLEATGRITARGDLDRPAPYGRLDVRRGGKVVIQGREFTITDGSLSYAGDWNATVALRAEAVVSDVEDYADYRVRVSLEGSVDAPGLSLSSEPPRTRQEIASLIATGRLHSTLVDTSAWLLGGQAATLVSGRIGRRVAGSFGLDEITVRPDLVARDTDPSARFTFGKRFGRRLRIIYSAGLGGPETRFVEVEARPGFDVALRAQRTDTGENTFGAGQRFEWGAARPEERGDDERVRLADVRIESETPLDEDLRSSVRLSPGRRVLDWQVQDAADRLRDRLRRRGHLDAEVEARLEGDVAVLSVMPGPVYGWKVEGLDRPPDLDPVLRQALFEADALDLGRARLLRALHTRGHLRAEVAGTARDGEDGRRWLVFSVTLGPRYERVDVRFPGAVSLTKAALLYAAGGAAAFLERPEAAVAAVKDAYRARHFLETTVAEPRAEVSETSVAIVVAVEEGPPARLVALRFEGATLPEAELRDAAALENGVLFSEPAANGAIDRVRGLYLSHGYADVRVRPELVADGSDLALVLRVTEGERHEVQEITLEGNDRTRDSLVRRAMGLEKGDPLDPRRLSGAERRLLNLGVFSRAAIIPRPDAPSSLRVNLEEGHNLGAGYDLRWDDGTGASALVEGEARNLLGLGLAVGGRYRYGGDFRETRGSLYLPAALTGGDVTASAFRTEQDFSVVDFTITRIQKGFQVQQSLRLPDRWELLAGYRFRRNTTLAPELDPDPIDVGGIDLSVLRNTRDDLLDPLHGSFLSVNLDIAPAVLGSDAPLLKGYAQASFARTFAGGALTWAQGYRLGLATGFDGEPVLPAERFQAGGANSLRGFGTNEVGPRGPLGDPSGGEAVLILNQELRYRHRSGLGGVVFYDGGNVFETVRDLSFEIRHTLGAGLRWASPVGLLRVDVGFPLNRQPEEKRHRIFFSLGQAF